MSNKTERYLNLEGLRGAAALVVVVYHYIAAFAPFVYVKTYLYNQTWYYFLLTVPAKLLLSGDFSVCIFFVLSGFVLSISFFKYRTINTLVSASARRYFRLMIPAFISVIFSYAILRVGLMVAHTTGRLNPQTSLLTTFWAFPPHLFSAIYQGVFGIFFTNFNSYNPVLWTMQVELYGSFLIFTFLALFGKLPRRWIFYCALALVTAKSYYLGLILGMALCDIWVNYPSLKSAISNKLLLSLLPVGVLLGMWDRLNVFYSSIRIPMYSAAQLQVFAHIIGALVIVVAVLQLSLLKRFFELRPLQYLGRISFSLYLTHFVLMGSLACLIFNLVLPSLGYKWALVSTFILAISLSVLFAGVYAKYVDVRSIAWSKTIGEWLTHAPERSDYIIKATEPFSMSKHSEVSTTTLETVEQKA